MKDSGKEFINILNQAIEYHCNEEILSSPIERRMSAKDSIKMVTNYSKGEYSKIIEGLIPENFDTSSLSNISAINGISLKFINVIKTIPPGTNLNLGLFEEVITAQVQAFKPSHTEVINLWSNYLNDVISNVQEEGKEDIFTDIVYLEKYVKSKDFLEKLMNETGATFKPEEELELNSFYQSLIPIDQAEDRLQKLKQRRNDYLNSKTVNLENGLTLKQETALKLLTKAYNGEKLDSKDLSLVQNFILDSFGNKQLSQALKDLSHKNISGKVIKNCYKLSRANLEKFLKAEEKLSQNYDQLGNSTKFHNISTDEYKTIDNFTKVKDLFYKLNKENLLKDNPELNSIYSKVRRGPANMEKLTNRLYDNLTERAKSGHLKKQIQDKVMSKSFTFEEKTKLFSKGFFTEEKNGFAKVEVGRISDLVSKDYKGQLEQRYGPDWQEKVDKMYKDIEKTNSSDSITKNIANKLKSVASSFLSRKTDPIEGVSSKNLTDLNIQLRKELNVTDSNIKIVDKNFKNQNIKTEQPFKPSSTPNTKSVNNVQAR